MIGCSPSYSLRIGKETFFEPPIRSPRFVLSRNCNSSICARKSMSIFPYNIIEIILQQGVECPCIFYDDKSLFDDSL